MFGDFCYTIHKNFNERTACLLRSLTHNYTYTCTTVIEIGGTIPYSLSSSDIQVDSFIHKTVFLNLAAGQQNVFINTMLRKKQSFFIPV